MKPTSSSTDAEAEPLVSPSSRRNAAIRAQAEIERINDADKQFRAEDKMFRASVREARRKEDSTSELAPRLKSMSITPVPMGTQFTRARDGRSNKKPAARSRNVDDILADDSNEDLDISEFTFVNGVIIQLGQERRLMDAD